MILLPRHTGVLSAGRVPAGAHFLVRWVNATQKGVCLACVVVLC